MSEHKCSICGEIAGYVHGDEYLCYACAATIASIHANCLQNEARLRGEDVVPDVYDWDACLDYCDIKEVEEESEK